MKITTRAELLSRPPNLMMSACCDGDLHFHYALYAVCARCLEPRSVLLIQPPGAGGSRIVCGEHSEGQILGAMVQDSLHLVCEVTGDETGRSYHVERVDTFMPDDDEVWIGKLVAGSARMAGEKERAIYWLCRYLNEPFRPGGQYAIDPAEVKRALEEMGYDDARRARMLELSEPGLVQQ